MTPTPSAYQTMITPRSRRLRTTGLVLLVAAITMALYGFFVLMPSLKRSLEASKGAGPIIQSVSPAAGTTAAARSRNDVHSVRIRRVAAVKVLTAYAYWTVCGLLVVAMVFVAWLDLREVSRAYLNQRRAIWAETASSLEAKETKSRSDLDSDQG